MDIYKCPKMNIPTLLLKKENIQYFQFAGVINPAILIKLLMVFQYLIHNIYNDNSL